MDVVESLVVLQATISACSDPTAGPQTLPRRTGRKTELDVDRTVNDAGLEAVVHIAKRDHGGHDIVTAVEYASVVVFPEALAGPQPNLGSCLNQTQGCGLKAGARHDS